LPISELAGNSKNSSHYAIRLLAVVRFFKPLGENFMATLIWHFRCLSLLLPSISQRSRSVFPHFPTCCYSVFGTNWLKPAQNAFHHHGKSFPAPLSALLSQVSLLHAVLYPQNFHSLPAKRE